MTVPIATFRLQLHPGFTFADARRRLEQVAALGVSHLYLCPIFQARPGSSHGYDVTDPTRIRDELGGEGEFLRLAGDARTRGLGIILDIVPNHMAAHHDNPWWWGALKHGRGSDAAAFFDIDWDAGHNRLVLPILGQTLDKELQAGAIKLAARSPAAPGGDREEAEPCIQYHEHLFPLSPESLKLLPPDPAGASHAQLRRLLARQHYRLLHWRDGARWVNYRRFFDINDLACVRVEDENVFRITHALILRLARDGVIDGVRIDHVDGLRDPTGYLDHLAEALPPRPAPGEPPYVYVEKILAHDEPLPEDWPVDGATGYEFLNAANALFIDPAGFRTIRDHARAALRLPASFHDSADAAKRFVARRLFRPELDRLTAVLARADSLARRPARDGAGAGDAAGGEDGADPSPLSSSALTGALTAVTAGMSVYRTYRNGGELSAEDRRRVEAALDRAALDTAVDPRALGLLRRVLLPDGPDPGLGPVRDEFFDRWQQLCGPLMAKGVEDTALYRHITLASLNDVGGEADLSPDPAAVFHEFNRRRAAAHPRSMNATATHDTKRGEDTRLRISALSQFADDWIAFIDRWTRRHEPLRALLSGGPAPTRTDQILFYQSFLGSWPPGQEPTEDLADRLAAYMLKAAKEAKLRTSWREPDEPYRRALERFVRALVIGPEGSAFREEARRLHRLTAFHAALSSIAQVVLKCFCPGVPDFYQGTDLWDLSLVDPDNRRPVDYDHREALMRDLSEATNHGSAPSAPPPDFTSSWPDGRIKLYTTIRALHARRAAIHVLAEGEYLPLTTEGPHADSLLAFARRAGDDWLIAAIPRLTSRLVPVDLPPVGPDVWADTAIGLPHDAPTRWTEILTDAGAILATPGPERTLAAADLLAAFPAAVAMGSMR